MYRTRLATLGSIALALITGVLFTTSVLAGAASLQNKWKSTYLDANGANVIESANASPAWIIELTGIGDFVRLKSTKTGGYLHIENGPLEVGAAEPGWWSAMWVLDPVDSEFVRLQNRWKPDLHVHNETGALTAGAIEPGWWSAMWRVNEHSLGSGAATSSGSSSGAGQSAARSSSASTSSAVATSSAASTSSTAGQIELVFRNNSSLSVHLYKGTGQSPSFVVSVHPDGEQRVTSTSDAAWLALQDGEWIGKIALTGEAVQVVEFQ